MTLPDLCVCGHPRRRHLLDKRDCRTCPECTEFELAGSMVLDVTALLGEVQADASREAELVEELADAKRQISDLYKNEDIRARLLRERSAEIKSLRVQLEHAEQYARDLQDEGVVPDGTVVVLFAYDAWQCLGGSVNCSRRYYADDPDHGCGPLTPVTVTVSRRTPS